jgi:hypothetical protein
MRVKGTEKVGLFRMGENDNIFYINRIWGAQRLFVLIVCKCKLQKTNYFKLLILLLKIFVGNRQT